MKMKKILIFCTDSHAVQHEVEAIFYLSSKHITEVIVLGERMSPVAVDKFGLVGKTIWTG